MTRMTMKTILVIMVAACLAGCGVTPPKELTPEQQQALCTWEGLPEPVQTALLGAPLAHIGFFSPSEEPIAAWAVRFLLRQGAHRAPAAEAQLVIETKPKPDGMVGLIVRDTKTKMVLVTGESDLPDGDYDLAVSLRQLTQGLAEERAVAVVSPPRR